MGSNSILAGIGATVLAVTLLVCGFAVCCLPGVTTSLAGTVSTGETSPYTHDQLVELAGVTRAFTVDPHRDAEAAAEDVAAAVVDAARAASAEGAPKAGEWTDAARRALDAPGTSLDAMDALAKVSDRYALDGAAVSHLEDCNRLITGVSSWLGMIGVAALVVGVLLGVRRQWAALAFMLRMGPALLLALLAVLGLWGVVDFNGLFAAFHSLFFVDGTWTFSYDSLLISMYPLDFWMGMGGVWLATSVGLGVVCFIGGCVAAWRAQVQARELRDAAEAAARKGKGKGKKGRR